MNGVTEGEASEEPIGHNRIPPHRDVKAIIPLFRNAHLMDSLLSGILACKEEFIASRVTVMFINDSPDDSELEKAIHSTCEILKTNGIPVELSKNDRNLGFIKSVNKGLESASKNGQDVLLLNSDVVLKEGCLKELQSIAYIDSMIGFVSPRSNNASICSFPHLTDGISSVEDTSPQHRVAAKWMPRFHYAPTAVGFCLYIKYKILADFGFLDEIYGLGYNEENDLVLRANRAGYQATIANRAYAYHLGSASFGTRTQKSRDRRNFRILNRRYPEYLPMLNRYRSGPLYLSEKNFSFLVPDENGQIDLGVDLSGMNQLSHDALETMIRFLERLARPDGPFRISVICSWSLAKRPEINGLKNIRLCLPDSKKAFGILLRVGPPETWREARRIAMSGALNVYYLLDLASWDCEYLSSKSKDKESVWNFALKYAEGLLFGSHHVRNQFHLRFSIPKEIPQSVVLPSTNPMEFPGSETNSTLGNDHILVVGNELPYQFVSETVSILLDAFPDFRIVAIGLESHGSPLVKAVPYLNIPGNFMDECFRNAACVVLPSHNEGFTFSALRGIAYNKPIYLREGPLTEEMQDHFARPWLLHPYETTQDLIGMLKENPLLNGSGAPPEEREPLFDRCTTWQESAIEIEEFLTGLMKERKSNSLVRIRELECHLPFVRRIFRNYIFPIRFLGPTLITILLTFRGLKRYLKTLGNAPSKNS